MKYLYRAINPQDESYIYNDQDVFCSLITNKNKGIKYSQVYNEVYRKNKIFAPILDRSIAHVSQANKKLDKTPLISTSSSINFVLKEYSIPQNGKYNTYEFRKNLIIIRVNDENILNLERKNRLDNYGKYEGKVISLENNELNNLVSKQIVVPLYKDKLSMFYDSKKQNKIVNVRGFSNFATGAYENLFINKIKKEDIVFVLPPFIQDLIFCQTCYMKEEEINDNILSIVKKAYRFAKKQVFLSNEEQNLFNDIYCKNKDNCYYSLTNLILNDNGKYSFHGKLEDRYEKLKDLKRNILSKFTNIKKEQIALVDDYVYVLNKNKVKKGVISKKVKINKKNVYDILLITQDNGEMVKPNVKQLSKVIR